MADILSNEGVQASDLDPIAELVAELVRYEGALARLAAAKLGSVEAPQRRRSMVRGLHALHTYLFSRVLPETPTV